MNQAPPHVLYGVAGGTARSEVLALPAKASDGVGIGARERIITAVITEQVFKVVLVAVGGARRERILNPFRERAWSTLAQSGGGQNAESSRGDQEGAHFDCEGREWTERKTRYGGEVRSQTNSETECH